MAILKKGWRLKWTRFRVGSSEDPVLSWVFPLGILPSSNTKCLRKASSCFQQRKRESIHLKYTQRVLHKSSPRRKYFARVFSDLGKWQLDNCNPVAFLSHWGVETELRNILKVTAQGLKPTKRLIVIKIL